MLLKMPTIHIKCYSKTIFEKRRRKSHTKATFFIKAMADLQQTVLILNFQTGAPGQTVEKNIRLILHVAERSDHRLHCFIIVDLSLAEFIGIRRDRVHI